MQTVSSAFTAEARDKVRTPAQSVQVAWKKDFRSSITFFTIGVSTIGGPDIIPGPQGINSAWNKYLYEDESSNVMGLSYERSYNLPVGGVSKALADVDLDNTTGRYLPDYMGGTSAIFTAILPRRPMIINTGFKVDGVDQTLPQFVGLLRRQPEVSVRDRQARLAGVDFIDYVSNKRADRTTMYTGQRSDVLMETFLSQLGFSTAQYDLDEGRQTINFLLLETDDKYIDVLDKLAKAEGGQIYQDEEGRIIFENRVHWDSSPHNSVVATIYTADVIQSKVPGEDQIINVVEIKGKPLAKQINQLVFSLGASIEIGAGLDKELFVNFDDPMLQVNTPFYTANTVSDGSGSDVTSSVTIKSSDVFARSAKYTFTNATAATAYITDLTIYGRPAKLQEDINQRSEIDSSVTAFEERIYTMENDFIQSRSQAESLASTILLDYATPNKLQEITILAKPYLQMGDLIAWQGKDWRIWGISSRLDPSYGFVQELKLLQREALSYFTIGVSTIGGGDVIAP